MLKKSHLIKFTSLFLTRSIDGLYMSQQVENTFNYFEDAQQNNIFPNENLL